MRIRCAQHEYKKRIFSTCFLPAMLVESSITMITQDKAFVEILLWLFFPVVPTFPQTSQKFPEMIHGKECYTLPVRHVFREARHDLTNESASQLSRPQPPTTALGDLHVTIP